MLNKQHKFKLIFSIHKYIAKHCTVNISGIKTIKKNLANLTFLGNYFKRLCPVYLPPLSQFRQKYVLLVVC